MIRKAVLEDMQSCASILNDWIDATPWMPRCHDREDVVGFYRETIFRIRQVFVAQIGSDICGFASLAEDATVTALYVEKSQRGQGIGKKLLDRLKKESVRGLSLWTMQANLAAQRFYLREGFSEVRRTEGDNEEALPDILYVWGCRAGATA